MDSLKDAPTPPPGGSQPLSDAPVPDADGRGDSALEVVTVRVLGRRCSFMSNRPELVGEIAALAEEETASVKAQIPGVRHEMDLAAHVAFRLARRLVRCLGENAELASSLKEAGERVDRLADAVDQSLGSQSPGHPFHRDNRPPKI
ncbi:MAG: hypothetical protein LBP95_04360 [Deltaproteobacteria bacterium]|jgi:hypothetical protein|nr:hypothetical protein [Deltaproteobacteria bacterium]